jgi:hypothetical protein
MAMMAAFATDVSAQGTVKGKVFDETGAGLPGANVFVKGTTIGTITDMDGNYVISNVPAGSQTITASFIGYQNMSLLFRWPTAQQSPKISPSKKTTRSLTKLS